MIRFHQPTWVIIYRYQSHISASHKSLSLFFTVSFSTRQLVLSANHLRPICQTLIFVSFIQHADLRQFFFHCTHSSIWRWLWKFCNSSMILLIDQFSNDYATTQFLHHFTHLPIFRSFWKFLNFSMISLNVQFSNDST